MYCKFLFRDSDNIILPYSDIIHLRRHFSKNELLGSDNAALLPALEAAHTQTEGIKTAIQNSAVIRGVLHFTGIMNDEKLKEAKDNFVKDYLQMSNNGGVAALDNKMDYQPITTSAAPIDTAQLQALTVIFG